MLVIDYAKILKSGILYEIISIDNGLTTKKIFSCFIHTNLLILSFALCAKFILFNSRIYLDYYRKNNKCGAIFPYK